MAEKNPSHRWMMLAAACCLLATADVAFADSHAKEDAKPAAAETKAEASQDEMMKAMAQAGKPGDQHAWLKKAEGKWKTSVKSWFAPGEPSVSTGTSVSKMIMGGRYLEQNFKGTMMGEAFEGYGLTGYDNQKGVFWGTWIDNMSTGVMVSEGTLDESGRTLTQTGKGTGPDGSTMDYRMITKIIDDRSHVFTMYGTMGGQESKMMEITYTR